MAANASMFANAFGIAVNFSNLDTMWDIVRKIMLLESKHAEESHIRQAINKRMENFELDKSCTIKSVLDYSFHKVVLNHLVMNDKLVLEPNLVKSKTRKCEVKDDVSDIWSSQYQPLDYVFDEAFFGIISLIGSDELLCVVLDLPDGKAAGLSGVSDEL
ncbi:hypothetical protein G9A89_015678 [Geosiphon pyriformis]|nr:hypothetical protein G9A89_015678 [Geosiphon pyriformis]